MGMGVIKGKWWNALGHFTQSSSFLSEINHNPDSTSLSTPIIFFDSIDKILQISEPKTSEPLHSSCIRRMSSLLLSDMKARLPTAQSQVNTMG